MKDFQTYTDILACPYGHEGLVRNEDGFISKQTNEIYPLANGQPDLRLKREKQVSLNLKLNRKSSDIHAFDYSLLTGNNAPQNDFTGIKVPYHLTSELISYFPKASNDNSKCLDLGCGSGLHRGVCEHAGFKYVGVDYSSKHASLLADAHALPFKDNSFDFVLSIAVLEHIQHPCVMTSEVHRVLKPGGRFIGTVSFLEPFHDNSYYHHTHLGVYNSLEVSGFEILKIAPSSEWTGLVALSNMHLFSTMHPKLVKWLIAPLNIGQKLWWRYQRMVNKEHYHPFDAQYDILACTGAFAFIADKKQA